MTIITNKQNFIHSFKWKIDAQAAVLEMTWVVSDYTATPGTSEVSVTKGQQVEIIDTACSGAPEFCLVRLNAAGGSGTGSAAASSAASTASADSQPQEGLVPLSVLKLAPNKGNQRRNIDGAEVKEHAENSGKYSKFNDFLS